MGKYQTYTCTSIICNVQSTFQWSLVVDEEYFKYISERAQYFSVSWSLFCEMQNKLIWVFWKIRNCLFQFCIRRPTSFFYRRKRSALFCCRGRIEIMYLFSWLLQNNLLSVDRNVVWNTEASANASAYLFQITFLHLGGYSATKRITRAVKKKKKIETVDKNANTNLPFRFRVFNCMHFSP